MNSTKTQENVNNAVTCPLRSNQEKHIALLQGSIQLQRETIRRCDKIISILTVTGFVTLASLLRR